jgi:hypothetical protein
MQMLRTPGHYWIDDPTVMLTDYAIHLNAPKMDMAAHLNMLCTDTWGGSSCLVTCLFDTTGPTIPPFITILAAPSMATYDTASTILGVSFDDIWDKIALTGFDPALDLTSVHCPVLAA